MPWRLVIGVAGGDDGGGGARLEALFLPSSLGSTEAYAVGGGGSSGNAGTGSGGSNGGAGGNSTFGGTPFAIQTAYGGGRGGGAASRAHTGGGAGGGAGRMQALAVTATGGTSGEALAPAVA